MAYTEQTWVNGGNFGRYAPGATQMSADRLQHMEDGIGAAHTRAEEISISVIDYGADKTGVNDSSAAFIAAKAVAIASRNASSGSGASFARIVIDIPPGDYKITQNAAMMGETRVSGDSTRGLKFRGGGRYMSRILWQPANVTDFLCYNSDYWHGVTWEGISFVCQTAGAGFMHSIATSFSSDFRFDDCTWDGAWGIGIKLEGTNVNSEWRWIACNINGSYSTAFLYSDSGGSDQQLNYSLYECDVTIDDSGSFLNFTKGGAIRIHGGDFIMIDTGTFFSFPEPSHGSGVQSLLVEGVRFEIRTDNGKLIDCHWGEGIVSFKSCDNSAHGYVGSGFTATTVTADFYSDGAYQMPSIEWENCNLQGRHRYNWSGTSYSRPHNVVYRDSRLAQYGEAKDFIVHAAIGGSTAYGGTPAIHFDNCRGNGDQTFLVDCTVGWDLSAFAMPKKQYASIKTSVGKLPDSSTSPTTTVVLPLNALILAVHWFKQAGSGSSTSTTWVYTLATTEGSPTTISSIATGAQWNTVGFRQSSAVAPFFCNSTAKRTLTLVAANIAEGVTDSFCVVEYLA
jgi:hypothetical protein